MGDVRIRSFGRPGDLGWVIGANGEQYAEEYGWNLAFEAEVGRIVAAFAGDNDPEREHGWIADLDGRRVGCVFCMRSDQPDVAQLRILLVHPDARNHGLGRRLVDTCVSFAREAGYARMQLWTVDVLAAARRIYLATGFHLVAQAPHHGFGADLMGQSYVLDLRATEPPR